MIRLAASSFELSNDQPKHSLSGYVCADGENSKSFQALKDLCSKGSIDEVAITYREYSFLLTEVTFHWNNTQCQDAERTFKFLAKDVRLEGLLHI